MTCLAKSPNKHNRIWMCAEMMTAEECDFFSSDAFEMLDVKAKTK